MKKSLITIGAVFLLFGSGRSGKFIGIVESKRRPAKIAGRRVRAYEVVHSTGGAAPSFDSILRTITKTGTKSLFLKGKKLKTRRKVTVRRVIESVENVENDAGINIK